MTFEGARSGGGAEGFRAFGAGADAAEVVVAEDAGGVAVGEGDLDGVIADGGGLLCAGFGLEHGQGRGGNRSCAGVGALPYALVIASGAGAFVAEISKIVMTGVTVGPGNVDAGAASYMNFNRRRFLAGIKRNGHRAFG